MKKRYFLFVFIFGLFCGNERLTAASDPFVLPDVNKPQLSLPEANKNLLKLFENEHIDNATMNLFIINDDIGFPGPGGFGVTLTRHYSPRRWGQKKSLAIIDAYVDHVWADRNYYRNLDWTIGISFGIQTGGSSGITPDPYFVNLQQDDSRKSDYKNILLIKEDMNSNELYKPFFEKMLGPNWDFYINGFNRIYIEHNYTEKYSEGYIPIFSNPPYIYGKWNHILVIPTSKGGSIYFSRRGGTKTFYKSENPGEPSYKTSHPLPDETGSYQPGCIKDDNSIAMGQMSYRASYDGTNCLLKTIDGKIYIFGDIIFLTNNQQSELGHLDFEYQKKIAFLKEVRDRFGNKITINYDPLEPGKIQNVYMEYNGISQMLEFQYVYGKATAVTWKQNGGIVKTISYSHENGKLSSCTDSIQRLTKYDYYSDGIGEGRIKRITYPNSSYTEYAYWYARYTEESTAPADPRIAKMLLPAEEVCLQAQTRVDVSPDSTMQIRKTIRREFYRTIEVKGTIDQTDGYPRSAVNKYDTIRNVSQIFEPISPLKKKVTGFEYDKELRLQYSYDPIKEEGGQSLFNCQRYQYQSGTINPYSIETYVQVGTSERRISLISNQYDAFGMITNSAVSLSNVAKPYLQTTTIYATISNFNDGIGHLLHLPQTVIQKDGDGSVFQQNSVVYNEYGQILKVLQMFQPGQMQEIKLFAYDSANPWLVKTMTSVFDQEKDISIIVKLDYSGHSWGFLPTKYTTQSKNGSISYSITAVYDTMGRLTGTTDENGNTTTAKYDLSDRMILLTQADGSSLQYTYADQLNTVTTELQTNGKWMNRKFQHFDGYGRPLKEYAVGTDGSRTPEKSWILDERGLVQYESVKGGGQDRTIYFEYDIGGRPILKVFSDNSKITMTYDGYDLVGDSHPGLVFSEIVNQLGQTVRTYKDFLGRTVKIEREKGETKHTTLIDYNIHDKPVRQVWNPGPSQKLSLFTYDFLGRLLTARYNYDGSTDGLGNPSVKNEYNTAGKITRKTLRDGTIITTTYDGIGRPLKLQYNNSPTDDITYEYDSGTYGKNKLTKVANAFSSVTYNYGPFDRLLSFSRQITAGGINKTYTVSNTYDAAGRVAAVTQPGKNSTSYTFHNQYNDVGQYIKLLNGSTPMAAYTYDGLGQLSGYAAYNASFNTSYEYDRMGRITTIDCLQNSGNKRLFLEKYSYDAIGNRLSTTYQNGGTEQYEYSPVLSMLTKVHYPYLGKRTMSYSYDAQQNRTSWEHLFGRFDYAYDAITGNLTNCIIDGAKTGNQVYVSYGYDQMGNTTERKTVRYGKIVKNERFKYNLQCQLTNLQTTVQQGTLTSTNASSYAYDHTGLRVMQQVATAKSNTTTFYLYDSQSQRLLAEMDRNGEITKVYVYGLGSVGYIDQKDNKTYLYNKDVLATPRVITDHNGTVMYSAKTGPFGNIEQLQRKRDIKQNFTGKMLDEQDGLYYFHARYYDPAIGRFLSVDPAQDGDNWWVYANNRPLIFIDPNGLSAIGMVFHDYKIGVSGTKLPFLGHAGVLLIDDNTGATRYFEFGRYRQVKGEDYGAVRSHSVPNVVIDRKTGLPTEQSLKNVFDVISKIQMNVAGQDIRDGGVKAVFSKNAKFFDMLKFVHSFTQETLKQNMYTLPNKTCGTFMKDVILAGGGDMPGYGINPFNWFPNRYIAGAQFGALLGSYDLIPMNYYPPQDGKASQLEIFGNQK